MKYLLLLPVFLFAFSSYAQTPDKHVYTYDNWGNRTQRAAPVLRVKGPVSEDPPSIENLTVDSSAVEIVAYPNPFSDQVTISLKSTEELKGNERIRIYSESGQLIQEVPMNQKTRSLETQKLANGKYILQLFTNKEIKQFILIKN